MDRAFRKSYIATFLICALVTALISRAGSDEELFLQGNQCYVQKDYDNALRAYNEMARKGRAVFYNMGNCLFYKGDYSGALVYWSRAEDGATCKESAIIAQNKEYVFKILGKQDHQSFWNKIFRLLHSTSSYISLLFLQLFFLICWYVFIFLVRRRHMRMKTVILSALCGLMFFFGILLGFHYSNQFGKNGIVVKEGTQLFVGPDRGFYALSPLCYADSVVVKEVKGGWYKVRYAGMIGWVEADVIQII